jgi:hypothetical protein
VFRLQKPEGETISGFPWLGFRVRQPGNPKPVYHDVDGPAWGSLVFLQGGPSLEAAVPLPSGTYEIEAVLRTETRQGVISSQENLWNTKTLVSVEKGKRQRDRNPLVRKNRGL